MMPVTPGTITDATNAAEAMLNFLKIPGVWVKSYYKLFVNAPDKKALRTNCLEGLRGTMDSQRDELAVLMPQSNEKEIARIEGMFAQVDRRLVRATTAIGNASTTNLGRFVYPMKNSVTNDRIRAITAILDGIGKYIYHSASR